MFVNIPQHTPFTLTFSSAPAGKKSPTQLVAKHPLLDKNWQISAGVSSLPAPPEPAPACLVAEEEAASSDRVSRLRVPLLTARYTVYTGYTPLTHPAGAGITLKSSLIEFQTPTPCALHSYSLMNYWKTHTNHRHRVTFCRLCRL